MTDSNSLNPGTGPDAAEPEVPLLSKAYLQQFTDWMQPFIAQMVQAVKGQLKEIKELADDSEPLVVAWQHAIYHLSRLNRRLEARHSGELDVMDPDHVGTLTRILQADKDEQELLSEINRRIGLLNEMYDELEFSAVQLKVKAWTTYGDSEIYDWAQEAEDKAKEFRAEAKEFAEEIIKQRQEILDER